MTEKKRINAHVTIDEKRLFDAVVEESDADSQKEWIMRHAREDAEEFGIDGEADVAAVLDAEDEEEPGIAETYDPDEYGGVLDKEQIEELLAAGVEEVNPEHVDRHTAGAPQGSAVPLATAAARYELDTVTRDDAKRLCIQMGFDTRYFVGTRKNDKNVPGTVVKRLGGDGKTTEKVSTVDDDEIVEAAVKGALARDGTFEPYDTSLDYEQLHGDWKDVRDYAIDEYGLQGVTADVIQSALYKLKKETGDIATEESVQRTLDEWPHEPEALVEWYVDEENADWDDELENLVAEQLEERV